MLLTIQLVERKFVASTLLPRAVHGLAADASHLEQRATGNQNAQENLGTRICSRITGFVATGFGHNHGTGSAPSR
jgi:hypothetical protein